jgi:hypothetical protein
MSYWKEISMNKLIIATAAALVLGAPLALAADATHSTAASAKSPPTHAIHRTQVAQTSLSARCTALGGQFDHVKATHKADKNYKEALSLGSEGKSLCSTHQEETGINKIESALTIIGVKPMVKG